MISEERRRMVVGILNAMRSCELIGKGESDVDAVVRFGGDDSITREEAQEVLENKEMAA